MELTKDQEKAINKGKRLKAFKLRNDDTENSFDDIWFHVLHEVDLFEEGEDTAVINKSQAIAAKRWLRETQSLTSELVNLKL